MFWGGFPTRITHSTHSQILKLKHFSLLNVSLSLNMSNRKI